MPKRYSSREVIRMLKADRWVEAGNTGSHHHFKHPSKPGKITIQHPEKDIAIKTANNVLKAAGLR